MTALVLAEEACRDNARWCRAWGMTAAAMEWELLADRWRAIIERMTNE